MPADLLTLLAQHGSRTRGVLGAGMDGTVFELDHDRVAKVWLHRRSGQLCTLMAFYDALATAGLALQARTAPHRFWTPPR